MNIREEIFLHLESAQYVSFDIFDTLLFRMVRVPYQIFDKTYEADPSLFPEYISACEWREIRIYAEKYAKEKKGTWEVTLDDIYREVPEIIKNHEKIMELELITEKRNTFVNPQIAEILYEIKRKYGKKVLLVSQCH